MGVRSHRAGIRKTYFNDHQRGIYDDNDGNDDDDDDEDDNDDDDDNGDDNDRQYYVEGTTRARCTTMCVG